MVRSIKLVGLAFMAVLAFGAVAATSASATALIKFSKTGGFKSISSSESKLETAGGTTVTCKSSSTKGSVNSEELALALVLFENCTSVDSTTCTSSGSPSGEIHIPNLHILLGSDENPTIKMNPAVLLEPSAAVVFKCEVIGISSTITVKGSVICLVKNKPPVQLELLCEKGAKAGEQKDKFFWDEHQEGVENKLLSSATGIVKFENEESNQQGTGVLEGTEGTIQIEE